MMAALLLLLAVQDVAGATGAVRVKSDVTAAEVLLDDNAVGTTPATVRNVPVGSHQLRVRKEGYKDHLETVDVAAARTSQVFVVLERSSVSLPAFPLEYDAYHQHGNGIGCKGRLTLTEEKLVFHSVDDREDNFDLPVAAIVEVSRSLGSHLIVGTPGGVVGAGDALASSQMPCQIRVAKEEYGFWVATDPATAPPAPAAAGTAKKGPAPVIDPVKTRELYDVLYQLWQLRLSARKAAPSPP